MKKYSFVFAVILATVLGGLRAQGDATYVRERLRRALPKSVSAPVNWEVSYLGKTEKWTWSGNGMFTCAKTTEVNCADLKPRVLTWWPAGHNWFAGANPEKRLRYELGQPKPKSVPAVTPETSPDAAAMPAPEEEELPVFRAQTFAVDLWRWSVNEQDFEIGLSLRSQLPEWIDGDGRRELIEWEMPTRKGQSPRIGRIIIEMDRDRFVFTPLWPTKPSGEKKAG